MNTKVGTIETIDFGKLLNNTNTNLGDLIKIAESIDTDRNEEITYIHSRYILQSKQHEYQIGYVQAAINHVFKTITWNHYYPTGKVTNKTKLLDFMKIEPEKEIELRNRLEKLERKNRIQDNNYNMIINKFSVEDIWIDSFIKNVNGQGIGIFAHMHTLECMKELVGTNINKYEIEHYYPSPERIEQLARIGLKAGILMKQRQGIHMLTVRQNFEKYFDLSKAYFERKRS